MKPTLPSSGRLPASCACWALATLIVLGGCAQLPDTGVTTLKTETLRKLEPLLLLRKAELDQFRVRGPFEVTVQEDVGLKVSAQETIEADRYLSEHADAAPLVVLLHGYGNYKEDHAYQAYHLASWGLHAVSIQLPTEGPWLENAKVLARLTSALYQNPGIIDKRVDRQKIVLVGYSFGGSAVAIALAEGAPAVGGILLDPSGIGKELPGYLRKIHKPPVMVIASDQRVNLMRQRADFYEYIRGEVAEISVIDAHHDDAQFPMENGLPRFVTDSDATEALQITFLSALTSAAVSLALTGKLDYAWSTYVDGMKTGRLYDPLHRRAQ